MFVFQHGFPVGFLVVFVFQAGFRPLSTHTEYEVLQIFDLGQIHVVQPPTQALIMVMKFNSTFLSIQNQCTSYSEINFFLDLLSLWLCGGSGCGCLVVSMAMGLCWWLLWVVVAVVYCSGYIILLCCLYYFNVLITIIKPLMLGVL